MTDTTKPEGRAKCGAARKHDAGPCTRPAGWGTDHPGVGYCKLHLGSTASHRRAASLEIARRECEALSIPVEVSPAEALLDELYRTAGWIATYARMVDELGDTSALYGPTFHTSGVRTGEARPHVTVELLFRERQHYRAVSEAAIRAGVEVRRLELQERQVELAQRAFEAMLEELGLDSERRQEARRSYARHLRLVG